MDYQLRIQRAFSKNLKNLTLSIRKFKQISMHGSKILGMKNKEKNIRKMTSSMLR